MRRALLAALLGLVLGLGVARLMDRLARITECALNASESVEGYYDED